MISREQGSYIIYANDTDWNYSEHDAAYILKMVNNALCYGTE